MISSDPPSVTTAAASAAKSNPNLHTCALINSSSYQFTITLDTTVKKFTVTGGHWYSEDEDTHNILEEFDTAEDVFNFIRGYIPTWCHFSIIQYKKYDADSTLDFHQTFKSLDKAGNFGTTFTACVDYLRNEHYQK